MFYLFQLKQPEKGKKNTFKLFFISSLNGKSQAYGIDLQMYRIKNVIMQKKKQKKPKKKLSKFLYLSSKFFMKNKKVQKTILSKRKNACDNFLVTEIFYVSKHAKNNVYQKALKSNKNLCC